MRIFKDVVLLVIACSALLLSGSRSDDARIASIESKLAYVEATLGTYACTNVTALNKAIERTQAMQPVLNQHTDILMQMIKALRVHDSQLRMLMPLQHTNTVSSVK
jgi:hypothetical protein